jgi:hypothetical protein
LVNYEDLLRSPAELKEAIGLCLEIDLTKDEPIKFSSKKHIQENPDDVDLELLEKANILFADLMTHKLAVKRT